MCIYVYMCVICVLYMCIYMLFIYNICVIYKITRYYIYIFLIYSHKTTILNCPEASNCFPLKFPQNIDFLPQMYHYNFTL